MKIAQLAPQWKPVPPPQYGGSELVASLVTESLQELGHDVTLFACVGSQTKAKLVSVLEKPLFDLLGGRYNFETVEPLDLMVIHEVLDRAKRGEFDIIHNHTGVVAALLGDLIDVPMVTTNHSSLPPDFVEVTEAAKSANYVSISDAQRTMSPDLNYVATVYHGIDTAAIPYNDQPDDYLLFLATMWKEKGVDRAIKIAQRTGSQLL